MNAGEVTHRSIEDVCKKSGINLEDVKKLRQWLHSQPHLPYEFISDLDLVLAYHSCNKSSQVAKQVIDLHYTLRTLFHNFFKDRRADDPRVLKAFDVTLMFPLETRANDDSYVSYHRIIDYDSNKFQLAEILRSVLMIMDLWQYESGPWPGLIIVVDLDGVTLSHIGKLDIMVIQQYLYYLQEAILVKLKQIHFLNAPTFMDKLLMVIKPFLKKELLQSLKIHEKGSKTIEYYFPIEGLPKEAGGQNKSFEEIREETLVKLRANADFFQSENKKRVVESLRPGKEKTISDIFGSVEGSFKKLDID